MLTGSPNQSCEIQTQTVKQTDMCEGSSAKVKASEVLEQWAKDYSEICQTPLGVSSK